MIRQSRGFTLIELITVLAVLGTVLFFTLPRFAAFHPFSSSQGPTGRLVQLIEQLKYQSLEKRQTFRLGLDTDRGEVWVDTAPPLSGEESAIEVLAPKPEPRIAFSEDTLLDRVEIIGRSLDEDRPPAVIFTPEGYSDHAFIYLDDGGRDVTIIIEPFLMHPRLVEGHVSCND